MPGVSINLRILEEADFITKKRKGKNRLYSLNRKTTSELLGFFDDMYNYKLKSLKEYIENKERNK
jgi:DNA-binding transcriptional ArsR family regulator